MKIATAKAIAAEEVIREYRAKYAAGLLSPRLIAKLEATPGWTWTEELEHPKGTRAFINDVRQMMSGNAMHREPCRNGRSIGWRGFPAGPGKPARVHAALIRRMRWEPNAQTVPACEPESNTSMSPFGEQLLRALEQG
jgi:hypothetical protein